MRFIEAEGLISAGVVIALLVAYFGTGRLRAFWLLGAAALPFVSGGVLALSFPGWRGQLTGTWSVLDVPFAQMAAGRVSALMFAVIACALVIPRRTARVARRATIATACLGAAVAWSSALHHGHLVGMESAGTWLPARIGHQALDLAGLGGTALIAAVLLRRRRGTRRFWLRASAVTVVMAALAGDLVGAPANDVDPPPLVAIANAPGLRVSFDTLATPDGLCRADGTSCAAWSEAPDGEPWTVALAQGLRGSHLKAIAAQAGRSLTVVGDDPRMPRWLPRTRGVEVRPAVELTVWRQSLKHASAQSRYFEVPASGDLVERPLPPAERRAFPEEDEDEVFREERLMLLAVDDDAPVGAVLQALIELREAGLPIKLWAPRP